MTAEMTEDSRLSVQLQVADIATQQSRSLVSTLPNLCLFLGIELTHLICLGKVNVWLHISSSMACLLPFYCFNRRFIVRFPRHGHLYQTLDVAILNTDHT